MSKNNYKDIIHIDNVIDINVNDLDSIDLLIGGSPCQSFSFAGKKRGMSTKESLEILTLEQYLELKEQNTEFEGQSYLFWEYIRILNDIRKYNPNVKFLLENVVMHEKWENIITNTLGVKPIKINSSLVSAQNRPRIYWTNISDNIEQPIDKQIYLKDILENNDNFKENNLILKDIHKILTISKNDIINLTKNITNKSYFFEQQTYDINSKTRTLKAGGGSGNIPKVILEIKNNIVKYRYLTPLECERLQTLPQNYTNFVAKGHRFKMIGNGWTIDIIVHILSYLK